jgi:hypothetical protein
MSKVDITLLEKLGMKKALLDKISERDRMMLISYVMDHASSSNILKMVTLLASMELQGKHGAIALASIGVATPIQLQNLSAEQIEYVLNELHFHKDKALATKTIKMILINDQQEKLYIKSNGVKGETHAQTDENEWKILDY